MTSTIGIDIGGTKTHVVRLTDGVVDAETRVQTPPEPPVSPSVLAAVRSVWSPGVKAVGAGIAGLVDTDAGRFVWGPHVAGTDVPVRAQLEGEFGLPAVVDNDVNAAAWGEMKVGAGFGYRHVLFVTLGTGIGGAIVTDGEVHRGAGFAGEFGHVRFEPGGPPCECGRSGCWETVASGPALERLARDHIAANPEGTLAARLDGDIDGETVTEAALDGDESAAALVARVGADFGRGLCDLIAVLDPEIIVVGGGLGSVGDLVLDPARTVVAEELHGLPHLSLIHI